jgi:glycine cleavage system H protein
MHPTDRRYSKDHEWIKMEGDTGTVGITDFAQGELGDIVYVEVPEAGKKVKTGEAAGTVESVKAVSEIYSPVQGEITEVNDALTDAPETVNSDPHGDGWIFKIRVGDPAEVDALMDAAAYEEFAAKK